MAACWSGVSSNGKPAAKSMNISSSSVGAKAWARATERRAYSSRSSRATFWTSSATFLRRLLQVCPPSLSSRGDGPPALT